MRKLLLLLLSLLSLSLGLSAQIVLKLKPNTKKISFIYRLEDGETKALAKFSTGESFSLSASDKESSSNDNQTLTYELKNPSDKGVSLELSGKIVSLNFKEQNWIARVPKLDSRSLLELSFSEVNLKKQKKLDLRKTPNLNKLNLFKTSLSKVLLPKKSKLEYFICSPADGDRKGALKDLNTKAFGPSLKFLGLGLTSMRKINLKKSKNLEVLYIVGYSPNDSPRRLVGIKKLKKLKNVHITSCALGYHNLPDKRGIKNKNFEIKNIFPFYVPAKWVKGLTIDMSEVAQARGVSKKTLKTTFTWFVRVGKKGYKLEPIPEELIKENKGVFTFDESLAGKKVRCMLRNDAYDSLINFAYQDARPAYSIGYSTHDIKLKKPETTALETLDSQNLQVVKDGLSLELRGLERANPSVSVYDLTGRYVKISPVAVNGGLRFSLPQRGLYVVKVDNQSLKVKL